MGAELSKHDQTTLGTIDFNRFKKKTLHLLCIIVDNKLCLRDIKLKKLFASLLNLKHFNTYEQKLFEEKTVSFLFRLSSEILISGFTNGETKIWDLLSGECTQKLINDDKTVYCIIKLNETRILCSYGYETLKVWDIISGVCCKTINHPSAKGLIKLKDNRVAVINHSAINILDLHDGITTQKFGSSLVCMITFNGKFIVSGGSDSMINIWELDTGNCIKSFLNSKKAYNSVYCLLKLNDNVLISGDEKNIIRIWALSTCICTRKLYGHDGTVRSLIKIDDNVLVSRCMFMIKIWNLNSSTCNKTFTQYEYGVFHCIIKLNNKQIASGEQGVDKVFKVRRNRVFGMKTKSLNKFTGSIQIWDI